LGLWAIEINLTDMGVSIGKVQNVH
jgi:hypothetical protein